MLAWSMKRNGEDRLRNTLCCMALNNTHCRGDGQSDRERRCHRKPMKSSCEVGGSESDFFESLHGDIGHNHVSHEILERAERFQR